jgi:hypothetical protein
MHVMSKPAMGRRVLVVCAPCRCLDRGHEIDVYKATAALERLRYRPLKARRVDVTRLAPDL